MGRDCLFYSESFHCLSAFLSNASPKNVGMKVMMRTFKSLPSVCAFCVVITEAATIRDTTPPTISNALSKTSAMPYYCSSFYINLWFKGFLGGLAPKTII